jgi:hypothetical protein
MSKASTAASVQVFYVALLLLLVATIAIIWFVATRIAGHCSVSPETADFFTASEPAGWPRHLTTPRDYSAPELAYPTKCVDCERQFPAGQRWRGQQASCFSCEPVHANKCFDCEK